ncbi:MAG: hypothetical protein HQK92_02380 [Nitrospirae bacterium]|nr:hypothetical protein [Nitrospirota bacterium]
MGSRKKKKKDRKEHSNKPKSNTEQDETEQIISELSMTEQSETTQTKTYSFCRNLILWYKFKILRFNRDKEIEQLFYDKKLKDIVNEVKNSAINKSTDCSKKDYVELVSVIAHTSNAFKASRWAFVSALASVVLSIATLFILFITTRQLYQITNQTKIQSEQTKIQSEQLITTNFRKAIENLKVNIVARENTDNKTVTGRFQLDNKEHNKEHFSEKIKSKFNENVIEVEFTNIEKQYIEFIDISIDFVDRKCEIKPCEIVPCEHINRYFLKHEDAKKITNNDKYRISKSKDNNSIENRISTYLKNRDNSEATLSEIAFEVRIQAYEDKYIESVFNK